MGMKRYKPLLIQVGILLFIFSFILYVFEQRKQYVSINFSKQYSQNKTIEIAGFEENERWQGNYSYDSERVMEGKSSIILSSWYGKENSIQNSKETQLISGYSKGYINVYVADKQKLSSLISFSLQITGENNQKKEYPLTTFLHLGWNRIPISLPNWKKITTSIFSVLSKPETIAEINLDRFWIENTSSYKSDIFSTQSQSLSLRTIGERTYLFSASSEKENYPIIIPSSMQKGSVTISLIPEHAKEMVLSLNNTSMQIMGKSMNECVVSNINGASTKKTLKKTSGKDNLYVFVKAELQREKIVYSISNNGIDFELCGAVNAFQQKSTQLTLQGSYLIDSYTVEY